MNQMLFAVAACTLISKAFAGPSFSLILATPGDNVNIDSLTADGAFAVGGAQLAPRSFTWSLAEGRRNVPYPPGLAFFAYRGVSADASTFVGYEFVPVRAFTQRGEVRTYIPYAPNYEQTIATSISSDGTVVGTMHAGSGRPHRVSFWSQASGHSYVTPGAPTDDYVDVSQISGDGSVIVGSSGVIQPLGARVTGVRWWRDGRTEVLRGIGGMEVETRVNAVSHDGTVAAGWAFVAADTRVEAVYWNALGVAQPLGVLPGYFDSSVTAMNADGSILGAQHTFGSLFAAAVWTEATGWKTMATIASELGYSLPPGWSFEQIRAISADGTTFAGSVMNETRTQRHGFVLQVPAPSCLIALTGVPLMFGARRRRL
jgi:hypothetical protein